MSKAKICFCNAEKKYKVVVGHSIEVFDTYSTAYKYSKILLEEKQVSQVENLVFPEHSVTK